MSTRVTSRGGSGTNSSTAQALSINNPADARNEVAQLLADIDGVPVLIRFLVGDASLEMQCHLAPANADLHSLLSSTVDKMVDRIGGSPLRRDDLSEPALATIESTSSRENLARLRAQSSDIVLRVGSLELDLLDRTAKRGDRRINLRPREFQLLRYMMEQSDTLLTRAAILREVWNYKIIPETNLVDVHMGKLRRKVDGPNEPPLIRNVRGAGFILSATALSHYPTRRDGRTQARPPEHRPQWVGSALQY